MRIAIILLLAFVGLQGYSQVDAVYAIDTLQLKSLSATGRVYFVVYDKATNTKLEEGRFLNSRKAGTWKKYYRNGQVKSEVSYLKGVPWGKASLYTQAGQTLEEGTWRYDHWVRSYRYYHSNGLPALDFNYNNRGDKDGVQRYFYANGQLSLEGRWLNGRPNGYIKEYYDDGSLKSRRKYYYGRLDKITVENYDRPMTVADNSATKAPTPKAKPTPQVNRQLDIFDGTGYHKLYNKKRKLEREGYFDDGRLISGKLYRYDTDGGLLKTEFVENGRVISVESN